MNPLLSQLYKRKLGFEVPDLGVAPELPLLAQSESPQEVMVDGTSDQDVGFANILRGAERINQGFTGVAPDDVSYQSRLKRAADSDAARKQMIKDYMAQKLAAQKAAEDRKFKTSERKDTEAFQSGENEKRNAIALAKNKIDQERIDLLKGKEAAKASEKAKIKSSALYNVESQLTSIQDEVAKAEKILDSGSALTTGIVGKTVGFLNPESDAAALKSHVDSIVSKIGLDKLLELKKQGGTLGALSEKELTALQQSVSNLNLNQPKATIKQNLQKVLDHYNNLLTHMREESGQGATKMVGGKRYRKVEGGWEEE